MPEPFWESAVDLARQYGIWQTAKPLRLDYMGLKKRLGGSEAPRVKLAKPSFVELVPPLAVTSGECVVEFESTGGAKMRIQWKCSTAPDWTSLLRAWREVQG